MTQSTITKKTWITFLLISVASLFIWIRLSYPQLGFVDITTSKGEALQIAENYITENYPDYKNYNNAVIFGLDNRADQFLQKTLGFEKMKEFLVEHDYDMFFWIIRFFKENEKEEFLLSISSKSGQITSFKHIIEESSKRPLIDEAEAKQRVISFLKKNFSFNPDLYNIKSDNSHKFDHRKEHSFSWEKKGVSIAWNDKAGAGTGKVITGAKISGDEILSFSKNSFHVPDEFRRELRRKSQVANNISAIIGILNYLLLFSAIFLIYARRNHLAMHQSKKFYLGLTIFLIILLSAALFNEFQTLRFGLPTTEPFKPYIVRYLTVAILNIIIASLMILMPSLAGELLHQENKQKLGRSFLHYIRSTFLSRETFQSILLGYLVCVIMLGIQAMLIKFGQEYLGVWTEYSWINRVPSASLPFLLAFTIGYSASFSEELMYRFYAINLGKKIFKNTFIAVIVSSAIWGFAHSSYPVFPMWFRGFEVTIIGLFISWVFLRFGIIPVIIAHFLFNAFWVSAGILLGNSGPAQFYPSLAIFFIPLAFGIFAFVSNKQVTIKPMYWQLNKHQLFNLNVLTSYLNSNKDLFKDNTDSAIRMQLISHNWDVAVIDCAIENFRKSENS